VIIIIFLTSAKRGIMLINLSGCLGTSALEMVPIAANVLSSGVS